VTPLSEISFAVDWARDIAAHLRLLVLVLVGTFLTTIFSHLRDVEHLGACASAAEVSSSTFIGNLSIAFVVLTPIANARDGAVLHTRARCFLRISVGRTVGAFCTTMHGGCDLDPLAVLHDWHCRHQFSVKAACAALSILRPLADCRNWARHWLWITRLNLHLILLTAFLATMHGFLGDFEVTRLGAIRATLVRALLPLFPFANAGYWARVLVAALASDVTRLVLTLLATMKCFLCHNEDGLLLTTSAVAAALTKLAEVSHTRHRARCFTAGTGSHSPICCFATCATTDLVCCHFEGLALHATTTAHFSGDISVCTGHHHLQLLYILSCALTPFTPVSLTRFWAARQFTGSSVHC